MKKGIKISVLFLFLMLFFSNLVLADIRETSLRLNRLKILNGDSNADGKVDIFDLAIIGLNYGTKDTDEKWNWKVDIANTEGEIDIFDLAEVGLNYGKDYEQVIDDPVFISPQSRTVKVGEEFSVDINISTTAQIFAFEQTLNFDSSIIEAFSVTEGNFLKKDGSSTYPVITMNNTEGKIEFANTRFGVQTEVSGDGILATINFKAKGVGISNLSINKFLAVDSSLNEIPGIPAVNGEVNVQPTEQNPPVLADLPDKNVDEDTIPALNWIDLYSYASDVENTDEQLTFSIESQSNSALINCNIAGDRYLNCNKPSLNQNGYSDVVVKVTDTAGASHTDTTRITVNSINDLPEAVDDSAITTEDTLVKIDVLANDKDVEGAVTLDAITSPPGHGSAVINAGKVDYTPSPAGYNGPDSFEYRIKDSNGATDTAKVNITVKSVNNLPVANANGPYTANEGVEVQLNGSKSYDVDDGAITSYLWDLDDDGQFDDASGMLAKKTWNNEYSGQICLKVIGDLGTEVDSDTDCTTVTINNVAPTAPIIKITPSLPKTADDLVCGITKESADVDEVTYEYAWYKNSVLVGGEITNILPNSLTKKGEKWKCRVIPTDGAEFGPSAENEVTIQNTAPIIDSFSPTANPTIQEKQSQGFSITTSDADIGDALTIKWYLNGIEVATGNTHTYTSNCASQGTHEIKAVVSDGQATAEKIWQLTVLEVCTRTQLKAGNNIFSLPMNQQKTFNQLDTNCEVVVEGRADLAYYQPDAIDLINNSNYVFVGLNDILYPGQGYFIKVENECYIEMSGEAITIEDLGYLGTKQLKTGWNLLGSTTSGIGFSAGTCSLFDSIGILKYGFNVASCKDVAGYNGKYEYCTNEFGVDRCRCSVDNFEPGLGYWIRTSNECSLA